MEDFHPWFNGPFLPFPGENTSHGNARDYRDFRAWIAVFFERSIRAKRKGAFHGVEWLENPDLWNASWNT